MKLFEDCLPERDELIELYDAVGWSAYTRDPDGLVRALAGSAYVVLARDDERLIGLARVVSDGAVLAYVQDILVRPDVQRTGVGRALLENVQRRFATCRQLVLLTDDRPEQSAFYESLGWMRIDKVASPVLRCFVRMRGVEYDE